MNSKWIHAKRILKKSLTYFFLCIATIFFLGPYYIMITISFKSPQEIALNPSWSLPESFSLQNYMEVFSDPSVNFILCFWNTLVIASLSMIGNVFSSSLAAYAFARLEFRGKNKLFLILLSTMMIPSIVLSLPSFVLFKHLGWINTFYPLIVPQMCGSAFSIFLLRQFFRNIPKEYEEAAMIDGANFVNIFIKIILPTSKPALVTVALLTIVATWKDFFNPLIYLNDPNKQTLEIALRTYQYFHYEQWNLLMAGAVIVMLPLIVFFIFAQNYFLKGLSITNHK